MEADHLRENPQTPQQQETLQAIISGCKREMRFLLAAHNQATRRNEVTTGFKQQPICTRLPQQETKSSTKQLAPTDPILGPENLLKTGFAQKSLPSCPSGRHKPQNFIETTLHFCNPNTKTFKK